MATTLRTVRSRTASPAWDVNWWGVGTGVERVARRERLHEMLDVSNVQPELHMQISVLGWKKKCSGLG